MTNDNHMPPLPTIIGRGYEDVFIYPSYSEVLTRQDVDTTTVMEGLHSKISVVSRVPVVAANMDTVTESKMCSVLHKKRGWGALHRFMDVDLNVKEFLSVESNSQETPHGFRCFVSVGATGDYQERAKRLYEAGARLFIIDIAHGHSLVMKNALMWMRKTFGDNVFLVGGNVATPNAVVDVEDWGADAVKVGIGPGAVCTTKDVTGVTVPIFTAVQRCAFVARGSIIADGGCRSYGDVAKAIGAGASMVMSGYFFAGTAETPSRAHLGDGKIMYRGMASRGAMEGYRSGSLPTAEGTSVILEQKGSAGVVLDEIAGGLRSAYSYVGAKTTAEFQQKVVFGFRR